MFHVYYSNDLTALAEMLIQHQKVDPNNDPFKPETILVQSKGMEQWLQLKIAEALGVAGHYQFPFPNSFVWEQYRLLFPYLPQENIFERSQMSWRLMRIIPPLLDNPAFSALKQYLHHSETQLKRYQLADKIADLFDQYMVYRPEWLRYFETNQLENILHDILASPSNKNKNQADITETIKWQSILWNKLLADVKQDENYREELLIASHRDYLQKLYFAKLENLTEQEKNLLPKRIFIFGISSLPATQLEVLHRLSQYCDIHLFFLSPSEKDWWNNVEDKTIEKMALKQHFSEAEVAELLKQQGNKLLTMWGKQGKDFISQLIEAEFEDTFAFIPNTRNSNLASVKQSIFDYNNDQAFYFLNKTDNSIQIHSCHSIMREVEVLHNELLRLFDQDKTLTPKDIIVMSADIDQYAPYINAVFSRYTKGDKRHIPFTISDQRSSAIDPVIASFTALLTIKESLFSAEELLEFFDVNAIREQFKLANEDLNILKHWIKASGIRAELNIEQAEGWRNYNSWENGLNRLLLGTSLTEENGIWENSLAFNESYGLNAELVGILANFIEKITAWAQFIQASHSIAEWQAELLKLKNALYQDNDKTSYSLAKIEDEIHKLVGLIENAKYQEKLDIEIIAALLTEKLGNEKNHLHFLAGSVNFCTLLPMRAIPFKVVCLLGMNEADFPRQHSVNSFDLMQFAPRKGDRAKRDDDRYLFLEALLSAQDYFYISYIGQSLTNKEEKHPSVLVAQLIDYLIEYADIERKEELVQLHPMTIFSPKNFTKEYGSYQAEWQNLSQENNQFTPFLAENLEDKAKIKTDIELEDLIKFIQFPVQYFFRNRLNVYFNEIKENIEESEHFALDNLENYWLRERVLNSEDNDLFFAKARLKGELSVNHFADLEQEVILARVKALKEKLAEKNYLQQEKKVLNIDLPLNSIRLMGTISNQFGNEIVLWRVGSLRDEDLIRLWIYQLVLIASEQSLPIKFYYINGNQCECLHFELVEAEIAKQTLNAYVKDFIAAQQKPKMAITYHIEAYFKNLPENIMPYCQANFEKLFTEDRFNASHQSKEMIYLQRIIEQSDMLDYADIHSTTVNWFELMNRSKRIEK